MRFPPSAVSAYDVAMKHALVLLVLVACGRSKTNQLPAEAWGVDDYAKAGIAIDKPWGADDFTNAATVLAQVTTGHRERLPRYQGPKSGPVFAKLLVPVAQGDDVAIAERFATHGQRAEALNAISKLYVEHEMAPFTRESIELMGAMLAEASALASTADPFLASFGPDDPQREARLGGLAKMKTGYGMMVLGNLMVAGDARVPELDRIALVQHVTTAMPVLFPFVPADTQQLIRKQAVKLVDGLPKGALRDAVVAAKAAIP